MELVKYELAKLFRRKLFIVLAAAILAGCAIICYAGQRQTTAYFFIHERRENYRRFMDGDSDADIGEYYSQILQEQERYIDTYAVFTGEMAARVKEMSGTSIYSDRDSFVYRNLIKTQEDFASFNGLRLSVDNDFGLRGYAGFDMGILFTLVFLAVLTYFTLYYERGMNLLLLLKGCKRGHGSLALAKLTAMVIMAALYTALQELVVMSLFGSLYGYGDMSRAVQSVSIFRNCSLHLTVGGALAFTMLIRAGVSATLAAILFLIGTALKSEAAAVIASGGILGVEYYLSESLESSGSLNGLKFINPFYCWGMRGSLGEYHNLNLFGFPVGKGTGALAVFVFVFAAASAAGVIIFARTYQIRASGLFERIKLWLRAKTSRLWRSVSLLWFELHKMLIEQKKFIVLALLILWGAYGVSEVGGTVYYSTARDASYHYYLDRIQGPITQDTLDYISAEDERLEEIRQEIRQIIASEDPNAQAMLMMLNAEYEMYIEGFRLVTNQLEYLKAAPGGLSDKFMVDESDYIRLWNDTNWEVERWLTGSLFALMFISGIRTYDEKRGMSRLLRSTVKGRRELDRARRLTALIMTFASLLAAELPVILRYWNIDGFTTLGHRLCWLSTVGYTSEMTIGTLLLIVLGLKILAFLAVWGLGQALVKYTKSSTVTLLAGAGAVGAVSALLMGLRSDITTVLLSLIG